jgi:hypothetical protein
MPFCVLLDAYNQSLGGKPDRTFCLFVCLCDTTGTAIVGTKSPVDPFWTYLWAARITAASRTPSRIPIFTERKILFSEFEWVACQDLYMSKPWRDTLEEAEAALSLDQISAQLIRIRSNTRSARPPRVRPRSAARSYSNAEARALLEQELAAIFPPAVPIREALVPANPHQRFATFEHRELAPPPPASDEPTLERPQRRHASLMAAIDAAVPDFPAVEESSAAKAAVPLPAVEKGSVAAGEPVPHQRPSKRPAWRRFLPVSAAAMIAGLAAYTPVNVVRTGANLTSQAPTAIDPRGVLVKVPLPVRRPSRLAKS